MENGYKHTVLLGLAAILTVAVAMGCARKTPPPPAPMQGATLSTTERAVIVHRGDEDSRRYYYRDESGKLYYVDQGGAIHIIERNARVERGTAGLYYIIDDDNVQYTTDQNGRLYYRDTSGRSVYIEDSGTGRVIDPLPILRGETYPRAEHVRSLDTCNNEWRKCTSRCDDAPGLSNKRSCLENCDYQREQCLKPY